MAALQLEEERGGGSLVPSGFSAAFTQAREQPPETPRGVGGFLRDQALNLQAGAYGIGRSFVGAIDTVAPDLGIDITDPELDRLRTMHKGWREGLAAAADETTARMSPQGQREISAKFLPGAGPTIWDKDISTSGAILGKAVRSAPSVVASILGSVFGGPAIGYLTAGALTAGDTYNDIRETLEKMPSDELAEKNPLYAGYLTMMPEAQAREQLLHEVAANRALLMGTITAGTSKYLGIEGRVASRLGGRAVGSRVGGIIGESVQEGTEQVAQNVLTHGGRSVAGHDKPFDWHSLANETVEAMTIGGLMGGALGGGRQHARVSDQPIADDHAAALSDQPIATSPVTPGVIAPDAGPEVTVNQRKTIPGQELAALDQTVKGTGANAGVVEHVDTPSAVPNVPLGLAPDEAAALNYQWDTELGDEDPNRTDPDMEPSAVPPSLPPVANVPVVSQQVAEAIGAAPVPAAVQPAEPRLEPGPGEPTEVRPPAQPAPEPAAAPALAPTPVTPTGNVLEDVTAPEKRQFLATDEAGNLKVVAQGKPRLGRRKKEQIEAGATEILSAKELDRRARADELTGLAERVRAAQAQFTEPPSLDVPTPQLRAYARALVEAAQVGDVKLANLSTDADPALRLIRDAVQVAKGAGTVSKVHDFIATDVGLRRGGGAEFTKSDVGGGVALKEEIGEGPIPRGTTSAGAVTNVAEEGVTEDIDAKRAAARRAELDAAEAARKADVAAKAAAAMEGAAIGGAKRPVVVETRKRRVITPQERGALTRQGNKAAVGEATARTPAEAVAQLQTQRGEENRDVLAREVAEVSAPVERESTGVEAALAQLGAKRVSARDVKAEGLNTFGLVVTPD